jgi:dihydroorotate dehydrogenase (NAD+) catalytic subunit
VSNAVNIPIIGMGGITTWEDAAEMLIAGATALQIGTVMFSDPYAPIKINERLNKFLDDNGIKSVTELTKTVKPW